LFASNQHINNIQSNCKERCPIGFDTTFPKEKFKTDVIYNLSNRESIKEG